MASLVEGFAELHCLSNFSFLRGASHPEELVARAADLGYRAIALTDECSVAGVVRAHREAKQHRIHLIIGSEFTFEDGLRCVLLATDRNAYGCLSHLITQARRKARKGCYCMDRALFERHQPGGCLALWLPAVEPDVAEARWLARHLRTWIAVELFLAGTDKIRLQKLRSLSEALGLPLVASNDVHMHLAERRPLQDTLTAIRYKKPIAELGYALFPNAERHLRPLPKLQRIYPPELLNETLRINEQCTFSLDELRYEYPREIIPTGHSAASWLRHLTEKHMRIRWPNGVPNKAVKLVRHELELIAEMAYEPFFLTVYDIVQFACEKDILCQGRGSAANSAVCYCLGITAVDPARMNLLFERFISKERQEPPDIDVDFEHERREEIIQYIYQKYGRQRAALAATVITYRSRSAVRDVGKALGMSLDQVDTLARTLHHWICRGKLDDAHLREHGLDPNNPKLQRLIILVNQLIGFPRHLSQHVGGFVIARDTLSHLVPIENAAMPERTVIQWDKDDLETLGLLKVDILGLGMLSAIRRALALVSRIRGQPFGLTDVPPEDPRVYDMLCSADAIGVFQIESRAQMSMLPRLRPRSYYDLVIEIAIVRPGPIQGDMVHPYLRRRSGKERVNYPSEAVRQVLERTLGVPIFQEQVIRLAMVAAGFSAGEADQLRRAMATWRQRGGLEKFETKLMQGMRARGYSPTFAKNVFKQIKGFGNYGFPESHSASFALLTYVSAWLKCHYPAAFTCALLNSQPMGFYAPAQLVYDARAHGVEVRPIVIQYSQWDCTLENLDRQPALRLGLRRVRGLSRAGADRLIAAREQQAFTSVQDLLSRSGLNRGDLEALAATDALRDLSGNRHHAFWAVCGAEEPLPLLPDPRFKEATPLLPPPGEFQSIVHDYAQTGLTLRKHPVALVRQQLKDRGYITSQELRQRRNGSIANVAGLVICRQRPDSASGVIFLTLEDETGHVQLVIWPAIADAQRKPLIRATLLGVAGTVQQQENVLHIVAGKLVDLSGLLHGLNARSRNFR